MFRDWKRQMERPRARNLQVANSVSHRVDRICDPAWQLRASPVSKSCGFNVYAYNTIRHPQPFLTITSNHAALVLLCTKYAYYSVFNWCAKRG